MPFYFYSKLVAQFSREETSLLVLRVMVGLIILYDWVHPSGAFCRSSSVDVKGCVKFLQQQPPPKAEPLLNALRYTTKHLNSQSTPRNIRSLLAAWGHHSSLACCCGDWCDNKLMGISRWHLFRCLLLCSLIFYIYIDLYNYINH